MSKKILNPEDKFYVVSLTHTSKRDKYFTLWRPNNAGYCWPLELAGVYDGYEDGYHRSEGNTPIKVSEVPVKFLTLDDQGRKCIKVSKESIQFFKHHTP